MNVFWTKLIIGLTLLLGQQTVTITLDRTSDPPVFRLSGWQDAAQQSAGWPDVFRVYAGGGSNPQELPSLSGRHEMRGADLVFVPRYPLAAGLHLTAVAALPRRAPLVREFETEAADLTPTTTVEHVYPSSAQLPENQLKFYIHFSAPMSRGEAYHRIHLLDDSGRQVELPFLELEQELWDAEGRRLTLFFDPGRIKRDVLPNQEMGPPIEAGHRYTLAIDGAFLDAAGKPLKAPARKSFSVVAADRVPLDPKTWSVLPPQSGSIAPLRVEFPEPLDHALMLRQIEVLDGSGNAVAGRIDTGRDETEWTLSPVAPWKSGDYTLRIGAILADLSGNMIGRAFEIDRFDTITERVSRETFLLPFSIR